MKIAAVALIAIAACALAHGERREQQLWTGMLRDAHGAAVVDATLRIESGRHQRTAKTAKDGRFSFAGLEAGEYTVSVETPGGIATYSRPLRLPGDSSMAIFELSSNAHCLYSTKPKRRAPAASSCRAKPFRSCP
jgi:hypothetical protein